MNFLKKKLKKKEPNEPKVEVEGLEHLDKREDDWLKQALEAIVRDLSGEDARTYRDDKIIIDLGITPDASPEVRFLISGKWYPVYDGTEGYNHYKGNWFRYVEKLYDKVIWQKGDDYQVKVFSDAGKRLDSSSSSE